MRSGLSTILLARYYKTLAISLLVSVIITGIIDVFIERILSDVVSETIVRDGLYVSLVYISVLATIRLSHLVHFRESSRSWIIALLCLVYSIFIAYSTRSILHTLGFMS